MPIHVPAAPTQWPDVELLTRLRALLAAHPGDIPRADLEDALHPTHRTRQEN